MEEKLKQAALRLQEVELLLSQPEVYADAARLRALTREQKELTPVVQAYEALEAARVLGREAEEMLADPELRELAREELRQARQRQEELTRELKLLLLPCDPDDDRGVVLELRAGVGGEEGALFAADLLRMYLQYADKQGWQTDIVSRSDTELGGVKEAALTVEGSGVYARLKFEGGTHCVKRVPETESAGRIHTSTATVAVLPEAEETEVTIAPEELYDLSDEKDNSMRGSVLALLSKKLLVNSVGMLFDLLGKTGSRSAITSAGDYLSGALYTLLRRLYRQGKGNEELFGIDAVSFDAGAVEADMAVSRMRYQQALQAEECRCPAMTAESLTAYPGLGQSVAQVVHNTDERCKKLP